MEILQKILFYLSESPDWTFLYLAPALLAATAVLFVFLSARKWFFVPATVLGAAGSLLAFAKDRSAAVVYFILFAALAALLSLLFLIPHPKKRTGRIKKSREDKMFEKFHEELSEKPYSSRSAMPQKICCFETGERNATAEEYGMRLSYADTLLEKLRAKKLGAGDRLETEEIARRLDCYRQKPLNEDERNSLNDCLSSVLKLTAKYQL